MIMIPPSGVEYVDCERSGMWSDVYYCFCLHVPVTNSGHIPVNGNDLVSCLIVMTISDLMSYNTSLMVFGVTKCCSRWLMGDYVA